MADPRPSEDQSSESQFNPQKLLERLIDRDHPRRLDYFDRLADEMDLKDPQMQRRYGSHWDKELFRLENDGVETGVLASKEERVSFSNVELVKALVYLGDELKIEELATHVPQIIRNLDMHSAPSPKAKEAFRVGDHEDPLYRKTEEFIKKLFGYTHEKDSQGEAI